jgi:hypothetical protein
MIILTQISDKIQAVLGATVTTNQIRCFASYRDTTSTTITPVRNVVLTNNVTSVDIVGAPSASTQRIVDYMSFYNSDTVTQTITIAFSDNGTIYILFKAAIDTGEKIEYQEGQGFKVLTVTGAIKTSYTLGTGTVSPYLQSVVINSDVTNSNAIANTIADITGLSFAVTAGTKYYFRFYIWYTAAATTTGSRFSVNGPAFTYLNYTSRYSLTTTTDTTNTLLQAYDLPAASNASSATTTAGNLALIEGVVQPSASGTFIARFASEVLSSAIVAKAGSSCQYQALV